MVPAHSALWCRPIVPYGVFPWCSMVSAHGALWCISYFYQLLLHLQLFKATFTTFYYFYNFY